MNQIHPKQLSWWTRCSRWLSETLTNHSSFAAFLEPIIQWAMPHWRTTAFRAKVQHLRAENDTVYTLVLRPHGAWPNFQAGQFIEIIVEYSGRLTSRFFSISSSPQQFKQSKTIELTIKTQAQGAITPWLPSALKMGDTINIREAKGEFTLQKPFQPVVMIAGGSGITPFRSMLHEYLRNSHNQPAAASIDITLLYYAKTAQDFLFADELKQLALQYSGFKLHLIATSQQGHFCRQHLVGYCPDVAIRNAYICGPGNMIHEAQQQLEQYGVPKQNIFFEYFGSPPSQANIGRLDMSGDASLTNLSVRNVHFDRSDKQTELAHESTDSLLSVAEQLNLRPVSGCRMGVCHQCICYKKKGVVFNTKTQTLSDTGPQEIQLCVSVAASDLVLDL